MCHTENIYGDKHKKQPDARKLLESPILLVVASQMFFMFIALLWAKCSKLHLAHNRVLCRFLLKPCYIFLNNLLPTSSNLLSAT